MKVKVIDEQHELDLEDEINDFIDTIEGKVIDIKFSTSSFTDDDEQIFCFSALIMYE